MKKNSAIIALIFLLLFGVGCAKTAPSLSDEDKRMIEHCKMMPNMQGCDKYLAIGEDRGKMNVGGMVDDRDTKKEIPIKEKVDISNLPKAEQSKIYSLDNKETIEIVAKKVTKTIKGKELIMFGYNGQIPGPTLHVKQGETITVQFTNNLDTETTIHWHGLRLENKFDGVPDVTQDPVKPGEQFEYTLIFPDEGLYWYHPHVREDIYQERGLYGTILVEPKEKNYYSEVDMQQILVLDDFLLNAKTPEEKVTHTLMGRFGDVMLVNGVEEYKLKAKAGSVVRFYLVNVANTRVFNISIPGTKIKLVGGDSGSFEKESFVDSVVISPSERYTIEVLFDKPGSYPLKHINPHQEHELGEIIVSEGREPADSKFSTEKNNEYVAKSVESMKEYFDKELDAEIKLSIQMKGMENMNMMMDHDEENNDGIEWEDTMNMMNKMATNETVTWKLIDKDSGKENMDIQYKWKIGDKVKLRLFNDPESMHPMQHPIHFHGQRFLVLKKDGVRNDNLVWKDTVLVPKGSSVDIVMDITNPGKWMAHCHIAEHLHSGMMMMFDVKY